MASISFEAVSKVFEGGAVAVDALDLDIANGELSVLVGPSGCGKTTSLRMVAGLEDPTSGVIRIGDRIVNDVPSRSRDIAMVFQNYALYPHMTVLDNLAFGLRMQGVGRSERYRRAREAAAVLDIVDLVGRRPKQLSGGQRQRVAMGRAIVREPHAFLMDEPLSNLDAKLRVQMRAEIARIQRRVGTTTLYVTHDQVEAMTMADRVAVMRNGVLQQYATPAEVYNRPANLFVAGFIGSPPMNLYAGHLRAAGDGTHVVKFGSMALAVPPRRDLDGWRDRSVVVGLRPEDLEDAAFDPQAPPDRRLHVQVELIELLGSDILLHAVTDASMPTTQQVADAAEGTRSIEAGPGAPLVARCNPRSRYLAGDRAELTVDTDRLLLFDPDTGATIGDR